MGMGECWGDMLAMHSTTARNSNSTVVVTDVVCEVRLASDVVLLVSCNFSSGDMLAQVRG